MNKLKVGIAGYGIVGQRRRTYIDRHPLLQTVALCDQKFTQSSSLENGVSCYTNYKDMLQEKLDILFVCLPNYLAPEVTMAGLENKLHVFCEKPPGRDMSDMDAIVKIKNRHPAQRLKYGFNHRYHDSVKEALRIMESGVMGEVINIRGVYGKSKVVPFDGNWRSSRKEAGGGILLDQGIHMVDLMRLFNKDEYIEIKSFISNNFWKHDVEDNAYVLMKDAQGRVAMLHSSATQWQHCFSLEINMVNGYLDLQGILSGTKSYGDEKLVIGRRNDLATGTDREEVMTFLNDNSWCDEINDFADAIVKRQPVDFGGVEDAYKTMKLVYDIYQSDPEWKKRFLS